MKILFNAREREWKHECQCLHCTSRLEVEAKDLKFQSDQRDGDMYTFRCPVCGGTCWIPRGWCIRDRQCASKSP